MVRPTVRPASLRQSLRQLRFNSSSSSSSSSPAANPQVQKAMEGAQKAYQQTAATAQRIAGPIGQRISGALSGYREPLVFNFKVFTSLCRQVYQAERLAPPLELSTWAHAYSQISSRAANMGWWRETLKNGSWAGVGIAAIEAYGIFCIGEMIGRRHLVGYKLKDEEVHAPTL